MSLLHTLTRYIFPHACRGCRRRGRALCDDCCATITATPTYTGTCLHLYPFRHPLVKTAIYDLKYHARPHASKALIAHRKETLFDFAHRMQSYTPTLVPIPQQPHDSRPYNHATVLAHTIARYTDFSVSHSLVRTRMRPRQTTLSRAKRLSNQTDGFAAAQVLPPYIILIDDVYTTGATYTAAQTACQEAGSTVLGGITLAH